MQMVKNIVMVFVLAWLSVVILMPKKAMYYKLEETLAKNDIKLNEKKIDEGLFSLTLEQVSVYVKGINVANIEEVRLFTLLFYTSLEVETLMMDDSLKTVLPQETKHATATHSILAPIEVDVKAEGSFGSLRGNVDLNARTIHLDFNESKNIEMLKPQLKKGEKGWIYETSF